MAPSPVHLAREGAEWPTHGVSTPQDITHSG